MKQIIALSLAVLLIFSGCLGTFTGDGYQFFNDSEIGGASPGSWADSATDTARSKPLRTAGHGIETETGRGNPDGEGAWPPNGGSANPGNGNSGQGWIAIQFPPTMMTPGLAGLNGEGRIVETKWSVLEKDIVREINKFRADPVKWCKDNDLPTLDGYSLQSEFYGASPPSPRAHNYQFPAQALQPSEGLHKAALHQAARGNVAHSDGSRVREYVNYSGWGENVSSYAIHVQASNAGHASVAARIVNEFIRDRGVADKGHRVNIANPQYTHVGIGCYNNVVIMQFGFGISDR